MHPGNQREARHSCLAVEPSGLHPELPGAMLIHSPGDNFSMSVSFPTGLTRYRLPLLLLFAAVLYLSSLKNGYVGWDDALIAANPNIRSLSPESLGRIFFLSLSEPASYQPLRTLAHALVYLFSGVRPFGYLLLNIFLYLANIYLFYRVVEYLLTTRGHGPEYRAAAGRIALASAAVFALHPLHVEVVSWLQGGKQTLMGAFFLISFGCWLKYSHEGRPRDYWISLFAFFAALASQPGAAGLPLLILGYEALSTDWPAGSIRRKSAGSGLRILPFILPVILLGLFLLLFTSAGSPASGASLTARLFAVPVLWAASLLKLLLPVNICCRYPLSAADPPQILAGIFSALLLAAAGWAGVRAAGRHAASRLAVVWFIATLIPTSGLLRTSTLMADRYLYLPSLGFALLAGLIYHRLSQAVSMPAEDRARVARPLLAGLALAVLAGFSLVTLKRERDWREAETLWTRVVEVYPRHALGTVNLAEAFYRKGKFEEAHALYRRAIAIDPGYGDAYLNLGGLLRRRGDFPEAQNYLIRGLELRPDREEGWINLGICQANLGQDSAAFRAFSRIIDLNREMVWSAHYNRAMLYLKAGDTARAVGDLELAVRSDPLHLTSETWLNVARSLERLGQLELAAELLGLGREELAFDSECWRTLGNLQLLTGKTREALATLEKASKLNPRDSRTFILLGFAGQQSGNAELAVRSYRRALELGAVNRPEILNNLGQALAELDSLGSAETVFLEALKEKESYLDALVNLALLYRGKGEPELARTRLEQALRLCRSRPDLAGAALRVESLLAELNAE